MLIKCFVLYVQWSLDLFLFFAWAVNFIQFSRCFQCKILAHSNEIDRFDNFGREEKIKLFIYSILALNLNVAKLIFSQSKLKTSNSIKITSCTLLLFPNEKETSFAFSFSASKWIRLRIRFNDSSNKMMNGFCDIDPTIHSWDILFMSSWSIPLRRFVSMSPCCKRFLIAAGQLLLILQ